MQDAQKGQAEDIVFYLDRCVGCRQCELSCAVAHSATKNICDAVWEPDRPVQRVMMVGEGERPFPVRCFHCDEPPCVSACISGAMSRDPQTGLVSSDPERCVGCWMCVMVCPFGAVRRHKRKGKALKCDRCPDEPEPACVRGCPTKALVLKPRA